MIFCHFLKKSEILVKFDIKNGFSDSFPFQKYILYIHHSYNRKLQRAKFFHNFWVYTRLKLTALDMFQKILVDTPKPQTKQNKNSETKHSECGFFVCTKLHLFLYTPTSLKRITYFTFFVALGDAGYYDAALDSIFSALYAVYIIACIVFVFMIIACILVFIGISQVISNNQQS